MALILNIETSVPKCSVSIAENGMCLHELIVEDVNDHISQLTTIIIEVLKRSGNTLNKLDAVAVSAGPGSFTGLRIGVSTAKGICHAINKPLIGVNTLLSMIDSVKNIYDEQDIFYCPLIDARRMEVFMALFDRYGNQIVPPQPMIIEEETLLKVVNYRKTVFFGSGLQKCLPYLNLPNCFIYPEHQQSAVNMCSVSYTQFQAKNFEDIAYFEPEYIKEFYTGQK